MKKKDWKEKELIFYLCFYVKICRVSGWLLQGSTRSNERHSRISWLFGGLRQPLPSILLLEPVLGRVESVAPRWGQHLHLRSHRCHLLCRSFSLAELPNVVDPQEFCAHGHCGRFMREGWQWTVGRHSVWLSSAHPNAQVSHWTSHRKSFQEF